ncbi:unnamed protein product [Orchesella dallaii]|uniref:Metalloendopeptidase n=1 Tax=Orchesella dallaii TaxID=48710 RepID=A0ABP1PSN0_9HEXA
MHVESKPVATSPTDQRLDMTSSSNITVQAQLTSTELPANETTNLNIGNQSETVEEFLRCGTILKRPNNSYNEEIIVPPQQGDQERVSELDLKITRALEEAVSIQATERPMLDAAIDNSTKITSDQTKTQTERLNGTVPTRVNITINKWDQRVIFFIDPCFDVVERMMIENGVWMIQQRLKGCLDFGVNNSTQLPSGDCIPILKSNTTCGSTIIGKADGDDGTIILLKSIQCMSTGDILHELAHALGIPHEQQRPDRDQYVTINWSNIKNEYVRNFQIELGTQTFGLPYNIKSEMQYPSNAFSKNGKPTIVQKNGDLIKPSWKFQESDFMKLRKLYCQ